MTRFPPERIVAALNDAGVAYVIVGGLAVAAHGVVRATRDVDLVPAPDLANLDLLAGTLSELGAEHPVDESLIGVSLARPVSFKLATRYGDVQVLNRMPAIPPYAHLKLPRCRSSSATARSPRCALLPTCAR